MGEGNGPMFGVYERGKDQNTSTEYSEEFPHRCGDCGMYIRTQSCPTCSGYSDMENRVEGKEGGLKNDGEKIDWSLYPLEIDEGVVKILMYGAKKYERDNWQKVENRRNLSALIRHLVKWMDGEDLDQESGLPHLDHAACDLMFIRWRIKHGKEARL